MIEAFAVGRRVAFDPGQGRLWAVCPRCGRWNLCPFEERWEALEECERLSRSALVRESGEEISLLEHPSGLTLVRVGRPTLAELVSWRFARSMVWRRRGYALSATAVTAAAAGLAFGVVAGGALFFTVQGALIARGYKEILWPVIDMETADGRRIRVNAPAARGASFRLDGGRTVLSIDHAKARPHVLEGPDIAHFLARAMPYVNEEGASAGLAVEAAAVMESRGGREGFLEAVATDPGLHSRAVFRNRLTGATREGVLARFPRPVRLAMEAASQVRQEDRVLSGELSSVMAEWREAEEIAAIADHLLDPPGWDEFKARIEPSRPDDPSDEASP